VSRTSRIWCFRRLIICREHPTTPAASTEENRAKTGSETKVREEHRAAMERYRMACVAEVAQAKVGTKSAGRR
jgi:hypothetical protein